MATFKQFLAESGGDFFKGLVYASQADTWNDANNAPSNLWALQQRWRKEKDKEGRPFENLNIDSVEAIKYVSVSSNSIPDKSSGFWKHQKDSGKSSIEVANSDLYFIGKDTQQKNEPPNPKLNFNLDKLFGPCKSSEYNLPNDFDEPWVNS